MKILTAIIATLILHSASLLAENEKSIGYPSVAEALEKLKNHPAANISQQGGWTIISLVEDGNHVLWFFAPEKHAAHPAMIKRTILEKNGGIEIVTTSFCQAPKQDCDELTRQFKDLKKQIK